MVTGVLVCPAPGSPLRAAASGRTEAEEGRVEPGSHSVLSSPGQSGGGEGVLPERSQDAPHLQVFRPGQWDSGKPAA